MGIRKALPAGARKKLAVWEIRRLKKSPQRKQAIRTHKKVTELTGKLRCHAESIKENTDKVSERVFKGIVRPARTIAKRERAEKGASSNAARRAVARKKQAEKVIMDIYASRAVTHARAHTIDFEAARLDKITKPDTKKQRKKIRKKWGVERKKKGRKKA